LALAKKDPKQSVLKLTEENVRVQVYNVCTVLDELGLKRTVKVKGFVYHVSERELREITVPGPIV
jgi:carbonic anhydrase